MKRLPTLDDLIAIHAMIGIFMIKKGGMSNGYGTVVEGSVRVDTISSFKIELPYKDHLTIKEVKEIGRQGYEMVRGYMERNGITGVIDVKTVHIEHWCYKFSVGYTLTVEGRYP